MKLRTITRIILVFIAMASTVPAAAQMTGSRLGKNAGSKDAQAVLDVMVKCAAGRNPEYVGRVMRSMPGSKVENKLIFANDGDLGMCMYDKSNRLVLPSNVELTMSARQFRIGLSKALAERALRDKDPAVLLVAPEWDLTIYELDDTAGQAKQDKMLLALYSFGDCVVAANPLDAATFISSLSGSSEHQAALQALIPSLGPCVPQGAEFKISPSTLAVALAEPIYHRLTRAAAGLVQEEQAER